MEREIMLQQIAKEGETQRAFYRRQAAGTHKLEKRTTEMIDPMPEDVLSLVTKMSAGSLDPTLYFELDKDVMRTVLRWFFKNGYTRVSKPDFRADGVDFIMKHPDWEGSDWVYLKFGQTEATVCRMVETGETREVKSVQKMYKMVCDG